MVSNVVYAFLSISLLGGLLGLGLAVASRKLAVKKDERVEQVEDVLPGVNCGACGFAGCAAYADAIVNKSAEIALCTPGGSPVTSQLSDIMGIKVELSGTKYVAKVHCWGNDETRTSEFSYQGIPDCNAAYLYFQGADTCKYGCLALGSCIKVCPVNCITLDENGRIQVDKDVCIGCEQCVTVCPTRVMRMIPHEADYYVACNSLDKGGAVRKYCSVGCIG